jgi:hypothetical protein
MTGPLQLLRAFGLVSTVRPSRAAGCLGVNVGWAGRSYTLRFERVLVVGRPCDFARVRFERESVGVVRPPDSHYVKSASKGGLAWVVDVSD